MPLPKLTKKEMIWMDYTEKEFLNGVAYYAYKLVSMYTSVLTLIIFNFVKEVKEDG